MVSASSYGRPVLVIDGQAYGPEDIGELELARASVEERKALIKAGYEVAGYV